MDRFQCVSMPSDPHNLFPRMFTIHSCIPNVHDTRNNGSVHRNAGYRRAKWIIIILKFKNKRTIQLSILNIEKVICILFRKSI